MQVAEGIYQVQLPLPFALRSVNCYLLRDDDGWTIVDSGLNSPDGRVAWQAAFAELGIEPQAIRRLVLTHCHPDHDGMAGWLQRQSGAEVLLAPREIASAQLYWGKLAEVADPTIALFDAYGVPGELTAAIVHEVERLRAMTLPHPTLTPLPPGAQISMGGREFRAIHTPGHSDGHLIFYAADERLALVGDHVLIKISPHVGLWPDSEPDPLGRYLASLGELRDLPIELALPGHGPLINDWSGRIGQLLVHHEERLALMRSAVGASASAYEVATQVFPFGRYTPHEKRFAIAETIAHLELLAVRGQLHKLYGEHWVYSQA